jgi:hypothetical protein
MLRSARMAAMTGRTAALSSMVEGPQWAVSDTSEFLRLKDAAVVDPVGLGSHGGEMGCRESRAGGKSTAGFLPINRRLGCAAMIGYLILVPTFYC